MRARISIAFSSFPSARAPAAPAANGDVDPTFNAPFGYALQPFNLGGNDSFSRRMPQPSCPAAIATACNERVTRDGSSDRIASCPSRHLCAAPS